MTSFSKNLKTLRELAGLSQRELGETLNVGQACVSKWEIADAVPSPYHLVKIMKMFNLTKEDVLSDDIIDINKHNNNIKSNIPSSRQEAFELAECLRIKRRCVKCECI